MALIAGSALAGTGLSGVMYSQLTSQSWFSANAMGQAFCDKLAAAIVTYITANAVVVVTSVAGVTTGGGVSGPGAGTIT